MAQEAAWATSVIVWLAWLLAACGTPGPPGGASPHGGSAVSAASTGPDREAAAAVALAVAELGALGKAPDQYRVVHVENVLQGPRASPVLWRIGFKLRELIPATADSEIGKGGDFFVEVDLATRKVVPAKGGH